jgi:hypothetical protein
MRFPRLVPAIVLGLAAILAACDGATAPTDSPSATDGAEPSAGTPSLGPSAEPGASSAPPTTSAEPSPELTPVPASPSPGDGSGSPGLAASCTGSDDNREFYASVAADVEWTLYCPVLPGGWFVVSGEYRLASGGGRMEITYRGPSGAGLELHEGVFCSEDDGCVPPGSDAGEASFGGMSGALVALDGGGWAVVVDRGAAISWMAVITGVDEAAARVIAQGLVSVEG